MDFPIPVHSVLEAGRTALAVGLAGFWLAAFALWFRKKRPGNAPTFGLLLSRVQRMRQGELPARYSRFKAAKARARLLAQARQRLGHASILKDPVAHRNTNSTGF